MRDELPADRREEARDGRRPERKQAAGNDDDQRGEQGGEDDGRDAQPLQRDPRSVPRPGERVPGRRSRLGEPDLRQHVAEGRLDDNARRRDLVLPERVGQSAREPHRDGDDDDEQDCPDEPVGQDAIARHREAAPRGHPVVRREDGGRVRSRGICARLRRRHRPAQRGLEPPRSMGSALENRSRKPAGTSLDPSEPGIIQAVELSRKETAAGLAGSTGVDGVPRGRLPERRPLAARLEQAGVAAACGGIPGSDGRRHGSRDRLLRLGVHGGGAGGATGPRGGGGRRSPTGGRTGCGFQDTSSSTAVRRGATPTASSPSPSRS